ncbi:tetratricopeptide repeat protein [Maribius pontilimi]|uniref:Tetratricopeptide repeat protein n=1 Tax=Palleronia pontilimi TaxID=1964209 RepID=A0A934IEE2_9RHOB|nr:tetratricopeptide repeat protein [Palleronia pontilimi]MBJ3761338.1 tetratricopeptide repeat protein [Palleronia pontilimi]
MLRPLLLSAALTLSAQAGQADINPGAYLAGRQAQMVNDYSEAARYLTQAMLRDPNNTALLEQLAGAFISLGEFDRADTIALKLTQSGGTSQLATLAVLVTQAQQGNWSEILSDLDAGLSVGPLFDGLAKAWSLLGDGQTDAALEAFDSIAAEQGLVAFGTYHKALALASLGRFDEADAALSGPDLGLTRRGIVAHAQILSQLGRFDDAAAKLAAGFGGGTLDAPLQALQSAIEAEEPLEFTIVQDATDGIAEVAFDIANVLIGESAPAYTLIYARAATYLRPEHTEAILMSAALLDELEQFDLAIDAFTAIPSDDPAHIAAEIGRAEILQKSDRAEVGIEVLRQLASENPDLPMVQNAFGDALRDQSDYAGANKAYTAALANLDADVRDRWVLYFARAVTFERLGEWDKAEADFRQSLEINPDSPSVLNYLGYSLLERGEKLDEALSLIEQAVAARPNSGFIVDSLGWGLYRLGRFQEAVEPMEKAVALMPVDPVVNDHLGDVYWTVGRKLEARFQWQRALSFVDNDENGEVKPERIRRKLEVGLDQVIAEEDGTPQVANDGG